MNIERYLDAKFRQVEMDIFTDKEMRGFYATRFTFISAVTSTCYRLRESDPRN